MGSRHDQRETCRNKKSDMCSGGQNRNMMEVLLMVISFPNDCQKIIGHPVLWRIWIPNKKPTPLYFGRVHLCTEPQHTEILHVMITQ